MKNLSDAETSLLHALLNWSVELSARFRTWMRPNYQADQIAADVAASGNPSGA
jgi:hypothetical protein